MFSSQAIVDYFSRIQSPVSGPAWELKLLDLNPSEWPDQGEWTEDRYLEIAAEYNRFIEFRDGVIAFLPLPTIKHQLVLQELLFRLHDFADKKSLGTSVLGPVPMRLGPNKFREPDILFQLAARQRRWKEDFADGADLVMEIVSKDDTSIERDYQHKRRGYAEAGIAEYWIVDPQQETITVLSLENGTYVDNGPRTI